MGAEAQLLMWWILFGGTHIAGSSAAVRPRLVGAVGLPAFKGIYSLVSFATFLPLCFIYARNKHAGSVLFASGGALVLLAHALMLVALVVLVQGLATPNPITTAAEMSGKYTDAAKGIQRVTRHPSNFGFALFGIAHCLTNPYVGDWIFFGGFVVYAVLSSMHQDARMRAGGQEAVQHFLGQTSLVPFGAILAGKQQLAFGEYSRPALGASLGLFVLLRIFHGSMLGGFS